MFKPGTVLEQPVQWKLTRNSQNFVVVFLYSGPLCPDKKRGTNFQRIIVDHEPPACYYLGRFKKLFNENGKTIVIPIKLKGLYISPC